MIPNENEIEKLITAIEEGDPESFHATYDEIIENHMANLDPEFYQFLTNMYEESGLEKWFA
jgi:hypothetical protein